jgi:hypothetical protein
MSVILESYLSGRWQPGEGVETELRKPVTGELLAIASARQLDLRSAFGYARSHGGPARGEMIEHQTQTMLSRLTISNSL